VVVVEKRYLVRIFRHFQMPAKELTAERFKRFSPGCIKVRGSKPEKTTCDCVILSQANIFTH